MTESRGSVVGDEVFLPCGGVSRGASPINEQLESDLRLLVEGSAHHFAAAVQTLDQLVDLRIVPDSRLDRPFELTGADQIASLIAGCDDYLKGRVCPSGLDDYLGPARIPRGVPCEDGILRQAVLLPLVDELGALRKPVGEVGIDEAADTNGRRGEADPIHDLNATQKKVALSCCNS